MGKTFKQNIEDSLSEKIKELLPDMKIEETRKSSRDDFCDLILTVRIGNLSKHLCCEIKSRGEPLYLYQAIGHLRQMQKIKKGCYPVIIVPFISEQGRKTCKEEGIGYIDLVGNVFLKFNSVYIEKTSDVKPSLIKKTSINIFARKSSRLLRVILENPETVWNFTTLSQEADVNIRRTFEIVNALNEKGFVEKKRGAIKLLKPGELLDYWSENYDFRDNTVKTFFSFARTFEEFKGILVKASKKTSSQYALTLHSGAGLVAPFVRFSNIHIYIEKGIESWVDVLGLKPVESGGTVNLITPFDDGVFYRKRKTGDIFVACNTQLYLDLIKYPARGKEQADFLRQQKMKF
jgi:predicted transcriptional regulator